MILNEEKTILMSSTSLQKTFIKCLSLLRVKEHLSTDKNSHVYKHLNGSPSCKHKCSFDCFKIVDTAKTRHCLKLKEAIYINRLKPELNVQLQHNNDFCFL